MKYYLFILIFILVSCSKDVIITEQEIKHDIFYRFDQLKPFTGTCKVVYYNSKKIKEIFHFKNGILNGEAKSFYINGNLRWRGYYKNGACTGKWEYWDVNGEKTKEVYFVNDSLTGIYQAWYQSGKLKEKGQYAQNRKTGKWIYYSEDGKLQEISY